MTGTPGWLGVLVVSACALGQGPPGATGSSGPALGPTGAPAAPTGSPPTQAVKFEDLPPALRLGVRAESVRRAWPVAPVLVIVPDEISYVRAVGGWTLKGRYPVLIDDGTPAGAEDIARFVRGFRPERIVAWSVKDALAGAASPLNPPVAQDLDIQAIPAEPQARRELVERAVRGVWAGASGHAAQNSAELIEAWKAGGVYPPGIIVADEGDTAWPAALALSAGRAEPIAWVKAPQGVSGEFALDAFGKLASEVEGAAEKTGLQWREMGDHLDAVTLCLNCPAKVQLEPGNAVATTDLLGRRPDGEPKGHPRENGPRWAWAGQVFGTQSRSAYSAMCALFIVPRDAWVFDGYPDSKPWNLYDGTAAGETLKKAGLGVTVLDRPKGSEREWRLRTSPGLDAGIVMVNTRGMSDEFGLEPGSCRPGDVPFLRVPALVHMVHSWSLAMPAERATVGGRWMERGAYAYAGSVQEPFLAGFVPTPIVAARLAAPFAWGAAARVDGGPAWKIAVIGDPLITLGPAPAKAPASVPLAGAREWDEEAKGALAKRDFGGAIRMFSMMGRDQDAAKLGAALLREDRKAVTGAVARAMVMPLARGRDVSSLVEAYGLLPADAAGDGVLRDALWHACYLELPTTEDMAVVGVLRANLREDQVARDAADLAGAMGRLFGRDAAFSMLAEAQGRSRNDGDKKRAEEAVKRLTTVRVPAER